MDAPVIIAGAGPVGLSLGVGLAHHGVRSILLEERLELGNHSKAPGIHARTLEIFRGWQLLDRFLAEGQLMSRISIWIAGEREARGTIDLSALEEFTGIPGALLLPQNRTEALLAGRLREIGNAELRFGHRVVAFEEMADLVHVRGETKDGSSFTMDCQYLVGCDGAHSVIREQLGWQLQGKTYRSRVMLADIVLADARNDLPYPRGTAIGAAFAGAVRLEARLWRIVGTVGSDEPDTEAVSAASLSARVEALFGAGPFETVWASIFRIHCRTSPHFRRGRVLLAGDAAHINSPVGGQGMNSGIHDAHNLSWKLARALDGGDAEILLTSYEQERRPLVLRTVDRYTDVLTRMVLLPSAIRTAVLRSAFGVIQQRQVIRRLAPHLAMLDARYESAALLSGTGGLIGRRAPDGDLVRSDGTVARLLDLAARDAALLVFDDERLPRWDVEQVREALRGIDGVMVGRIVPAEARPAADDWHDRSGRVWRGWRAESGLAALVRPDGHVGWMEQRPSAESLRKGVSRALGIQRRH